MAVLQKPPARERAFELPDELPPAGTFVAVCLAVKDRFGVERPKFDNPAQTEKVDLATFLFGFQGPDGRVYQVASRDMCISSHEKSNLFKFLRSWLGKAPQLGWDYCTLKGSHALLTIGHQTSRSGATYPAIITISPVPVGLAVPATQPVQPAPPQSCPPAELQQAQVAPPPGFCQMGSPPLQPAPQSQEPAPSPYSISSQPGAPALQLAQPSSWRQPLAGRPSGPAIPSGFTLPPESASNDSAF